MSLQLVWWVGTWWAGCILPFPEPAPPPAPETGTDTGSTDTGSTDTGSTGPTEIPEPVTKGILEVASVSVSSRLWPTSLSQLDDDPELEILLSHPWQAEIDPTSWQAAEPSASSLVGVAGFAPRTIAAGGTESCLTGLYSSGLYVSSIDGSLDLDGDGHHDVVVGTGGSQGGGLVTLMRSSGAPLAADPEGDTRSWCFEGLERFGSTVLLVPGAAGGSAVGVSLAGGGDTVAGVALFPMDLPAGPVAPGDATLWVEVHDALHGASYGGTIGAADFDGDGVASMLIGAAGDTSYDSGRVWAVEDDASGLLTDPTGAGLALIGRVSADRSHPDSPCGLVPIQTSDLDGDGADDVLMGFVRQDRLAVAGEGEFLPGDGAYADDLSGVVGPQGSCFGGAVAVLEDGSPPYDVAISGMMYDGERGRVWTVDGARLRAGLLDIEAGDFLMALTHDEPDAQLGGAMVGGDIDLDGAGDLVLAETDPLLGEDTFLVYGTAL
jgi:hypothetical protein